MASSYYVTYGTDRLTFGGSGSVAWEEYVPPKQLFIVQSDNAHVGFTGAAYDSAGQMLTSFTAKGSTASADGHANHVNEYAYYHRKYKESGELPTILDYAVNCRKGDLV